MDIKDLDNLTNEERYTVLQKIIPTLKEKSLRDLMTLASYELQDRELGKQTAEERKVWL